MADLVFNFGPFLQVQNLPKNDILKRTFESFGDVSSTCIKTGSHQSTDIWMVYLRHHLLEIFCYILKEVLKEVW